MITKITEGDEWLDIEFTPETAKETAILLRFARNANSEKPHVYFSFGSEKENPYCYIELHKRKRSVQISTINSSK